MKVVPGGIQIDCPLCLREFVKPEALGLRCAECAHPRDRHTGCGEGVCLDCDCGGWVRPIAGDSPTIKESSISDHCKE